MCVFIVLRICNRNQGSFFFTFELSAIYGLNTLNMRLLNRSSIMTFYNALKYADTL